MSNERAAGGVGPSHRIPVAVIHPSGSYRRGLHGSMPVERFCPVEPENIAVWIRESGPKVLVIACDSDERLNLLSTASQLTNIVAVGLLPTLDPDFYISAFARGASGVAQMDASPEQIMRSVEAAVEGEVILPTELARIMGRRLAPVSQETVPLSDDELTLLQRLSEGATIVDLAATMYINERTLRRRLQSACLKLDVATRAQALTVATRRGFIT